MTGKSEKSGSKIAEDFKDTTQGMMRLRPDEVYIERQRAKEVKAAEEQIALHESQVIVRGRSGVRILKPLPLTAVNSLTYELSRGFIRRYATTNASIYVPLKPLEVLEAVLATHYVFRYGERDWELQFTGTTAASAKSAGEPSGGIEDEHGRVG